MEFSSRPSALLAAACALGLLGACNLELDGKTSTRTSIRNGDGFSVSMSGGSHSLSAEAKGELSFNLEETDVESLAPKGRFELNEERDGVERSYRVQADASGKLARSYWVDGEEQAQPDAAWIADALQRLFREGGLDVAGRIERLHARGGVALVLDEAERTSSDFSRGTYLRLLFENHALEPGEGARALEVAAGIDSDFELARALISATQRLPGEDGARAEWLAAVAEVAAAQIESDFELNTVHEAIVKHAAAPGVAGACLDLIQAIGSDFERSRALVALAPAVAADLTMSQRYRELARSLSEFERGRALMALDDAQAG